MDYDPSPLKYSQLGLSTLCKTCQSVLTHAIELTVERKLIMEEKRLCKPSILTCIVFLSQLRELIDSW